MATPLKTSPGEESYINQVVLEQRTIYQERVKVIKQIRRIRALRIQTRVPRTFQKLIGQGVRSPLPWSLVQTINGMIVKATPSFSRVPLKSPEREKAARLADTCWPLIQTYGRIIHKDLLYLICDQLAGDGMSVAKLRRFPMTDWPQQEEGEQDSPFNDRVADYLQSGDRNPLRVSLIDPMVFWPSREEEVSFVVESGKRPLLPTLKSLNLRLGTNNLIEPVPVGQTFSWETVPSGLNFTQDVDEIWTDDFQYMVLGGKVFKYPNEFGFIPYSWRAGMTTSIPDPVLESTSVVFPFYAMDPYINTLLTALLSWAIMSGMPTAVIETTPQAGVLPGTETAPTDLPLGQMIQLQAGKKFSYQVPPPIGREVVEAVNLLMSFYDRAGVTQAARGIIGARTPGLTFSAALEAAADMVGPVKAGVEGMLEDIVKMTWKAVETIGIPLQVTGDTVVAGKGTKTRARHTISPSDINGYYDIKCELKPLSDQQMVQRGMHSAFMNEHQLWSTDRAMDYAGVENPEAERRELLLDWIRSTPVYKQQALKEALVGAPEQVQQAYAEAEAQGIDLSGLGVVPDPNTGVVGNMQNGKGTEAQALMPPKAPSGSGGPGQVRGAAPRGGGRPAGMGRRPTGPREVKQGQQFGGNNPR